MATREDYRILGVSPRASWEEIQRRYRLLAWQYHPDHHPEDPEAAAQFRRLTAAYDALSQVKNKPRVSAQKYKYVRPSFRHKKEVFEEFFGIERPGSPLQQSPGPDFRYDLQISFLAAIRGMETAIQVHRDLNCSHCGATGMDPGSRSQECPDCQGHGRHGGPGMLRFGPFCQRCRGRGRITTRECPHCHGQGYTWGISHYHLRIPPGTVDGTRLCLTGEGGQGFQNGPPGNLEVRIHVEPHYFFTRVGNDLHCRLQVSFAQAALGGMVNVPTLDGCRPLNLPRGTQSGKVFRLPGGGAPGGPRQAPGDQLVEVVVTTPGNLSPGQKAILEELASLERERVSGTGYE
ncbi:MAG: J domain-containing protein [Syntrophales bacterium]|nr:J domain-containing protein [Syntrophales bacterium]MDD5640872.1 J domain-containing protein [Syntrophales bacterium]